MEHKALVGRKIKIQWLPLHEDNEDREGEAGQGSAHKDRSWSPLWESALGGRAGTGQWPWWLYCMKVSAASVTFVKV